MSAEWGGYANRESYAFEVWTANNVDLYEAIKEYGEECLRRVPKMTPQTLGVNIKTTVRGWIEDALAGRRATNVGWLEGPVAVSPRTLVEMAVDIGLSNWHQISETGVGESWVETLGAT